MRKDVRVRERGAEVQNVRHVTLEHPQVPHAAAERLSGAETVLLHVSCETQTHDQQNITTANHSSPSGPYLDVRPHRWGSWSRRRWMTSTGSPRSPSRRRRSDSSCASASWPPGCASGRHTWTRGSCCSPWSGPRRYWRETPPATGQSVSNGHVPRRRRRSSGTDLSVQQLQADGVHLSAADSQQNPVRRRGAEVQTHRHVRAHVIALLHCGSETSALILDRILMMKLWRGI